MEKLFNNTFKDKAVLVTGHTGFKGSWLSIWLNELGANVIGYALDPISDDCNFVVSGIKDKIRDIRGDIRDFDKLVSIFKKYKPEIIFHLAAQPLVQFSYKEPKLTYDTNIGGTVNLLECTRLCDSVKTIINVTSDKCYKNHEWIWGYRENDRIGGSDPYSSSKACSELITAAYQKSFFKPGSSKYLASVIAGNVIGGGDWAEHRIIPDCIKSLKNDQEIKIRNPHSIRPWQYVLEPLIGYLILAAKLVNLKEDYVGGWNFGPDYSSCLNVKQLVEKVIKIWGYGRYKITSKDKNKNTESNLLMLDTSKSRFYLNWKPALTLDQCLGFTIKYYKNDSVDYSFCVSQIKQFLDLFIK